MTDQQAAIDAWQAGNTDTAITLWQQQLEANPNDLLTLVHLGSALRSLGRDDGAIRCFERALRGDPNQPEVLYNLGNIHLQAGDYQKAAACYQNALALQPEFALAAYNLGNACRELGHLQQAVECYQHAIECEPSHAPSYNNLGNILKHEGKLDQAVPLYEKALQCQPDYAEAMYNLGNALYEYENFEEAIPWFDKAQIRDADARALYCEYKCRRFADFRTRLLSHCAAQAHHSPQVATLAAHHTVNFGANNDYRFCPSPFDFVYHSSIKQLLGDNAPLRDAVLEDIRSAPIDERQQGRLHNGVQSSGNLFYREEDSFRQLGQLVKEKFREYYEHYRDSDCELIRAFPKQLEFESSWYIRMRQGGHLTSHIHETGWISGAVYLAIPERPSDSVEGCFEVGLHGDDYPIEANAGDFTTMTVPLSVGDIVLFPANLFHRTIPFQADAERICVAFDLKPQGEEKG